MKVNQSQELSGGSSEIVKTDTVAETQVDNLFHSASPITGVERGKALAEYMNQLAMTSDQVLYFALGFDFRQDAKAKRKHGTNIRPIRAWAAKTKKQAAATAFRGAPHSDDPSKE